MSNEKGIVFRTSMGGYSKADVNAYIMDMNKKFKEAEQRSHQTSTELNKKVKELQEKLSDSLHSTQDKITALATDLNQKEEEIKQYTQKLSEAEALIAALNERVSVLTEENNRLSEEKAAACSRADEYMESLANTDETLEKSKLYDNLSAQVGSIVLNANAKAEDMIRSATEQAESTLDAARAEAEQKRAEYRQEMALQYTRLSARLDALTDDAISQIRETLAAIEEETKTVFADIHADISKDAGVPEPADPSLADVDSCIDAIYHHYPENRQ